MENTIENKAKFFAQYWGQEVLSDFTDKGKRCLYPIVVSNFYNIEKPDVYLELKPLSQITYEDAIEVSKVSGQDIFTVIEKHNNIDILVRPSKKWRKNNTWEANQTIKINSENCTVYYDNGESWDDNYNYDLGLQAYDFLRSKSYALPYMDLSVENMIEYGWVKLTNL